MRSSTDIELQLSERTLMLVAIGAHVLDQEQRHWCEVQAQALNSAGSAEQLRTMDDMALSTLILSLLQPQAA